MTAIKTKISLVLACGLALVALPCAFAEHHTGKNSAEDMFKAMDTNGDGLVSRAEHAAAAQKMFTDADTNHDGQLTLAEMQAVHATTKADMPDKTDKSAKDEMSTEEMFKMCDQNGDGQVSAAEHAAHADAMFTKMDKNKDGQLSQEECKAGHKMMKM